MGTVDDDDGLIVYDSLGVHPGDFLKISRQVFQGFAYRSVSWGVRPVGDVWHEANPSPLLQPEDPHLPSDEMLIVADQTLSITVVPSFRHDDDIATFSEIVRPSSDGTYQISVFYRKNRLPGIYHALLPRHYVPQTVESPQSTRLVSARQAMSARLALTWLFDGSLEVHFRIAKSTPKQFDRLRAESWLVDAAGPRPEQHLGGAITRSLAQVSNNPEIWSAMVAAIEAMRVIQNPFFVSDR